MVVYAEVSKLQNAHLGSELDGRRSSGRRSLQGTLNEIQSARSAEKVLS